MQNIQGTKTVKTAKTIKRALSLFVTMSIVVSLSFCFSITASCGEGCAACAAHETVAYLECENCNSAENVVSCPECGWCAECCECGYVSERLGRVCGDTSITISDALEILKFLARLDSVIDDCYEAFHAARITGAVKPTIDDALDVLKYLANIPSVLNPDPPPPETPSVPYQSPQPPTPPTPPTPPQPSAPTLDEMADEIVRMVNAERKKVGAPPLVANNNLLKRAAKTRAKEIFTSFSHTRPNGKDVGSSYLEVGGKYSQGWIGLGENIALGQDSTKMVMNDWMNSEGHKQNILDPLYKQIAVGVHKIDGRLGWVQLFKH